MVALNFSITNSTPEIANIVDVCPTEGQINPPFPSSIPAAGGKATAKVSTLLIIL